jgi:hypothetical protein
MQSGWRGRWKEKTHRQAATPSASVVASPSRPCPLPPPCPCIPPFAPLCIVVVGLCTAKGGRAPGNRPHTSALSPHVLFRSHGR